MNNNERIESKEWLTLFEISQALSSTIVLDELLELILRSIRNVIQADRGSIMLFDKKEKSLSLKDVRVEGGIATKVIEQGKPFLLKGDMKEIPLLKDINRRTEIKSAISVPLIAKGDIVGVFNLTRLTIETSFSDEDLALITILAGPVAVAIRNSQLYHRIRSMAQQAENERDKLKTILEIISNGILIYNKRRIVSLYNQMAAKILSIDNNIINPITVDELFKQREDIKPILNLLDKFDISNDNLMEQDLNINIKGEIKYLKIICIRLFGQDEKNSITILTLEDYTKMAQTQKIAAWQMMARHLAHEIKNPLTPILWSAESLLDPDVRKSPTFLMAVKENANSIIKEVKRLQGLVSEFSSFAKMPEAVLKTDRIEKVLEEVISMYDKAKINIRIKKIFQPDIPLVKIDEGMMKQVFINLIKNAIEAMPMGGDITIITLSLEGKVFIKVTDTGVGIPSDVQHKVFDPYFTTKESGSGLGLTICSKIINDHGGHIKLISGENEGTTIIIILPTNKSKKPL